MQCYNIQIHYQHSYYDKYLGFKNSKESVNKTILSTDGRQRQQNHSVIVPCKKKEKTENPLFATFGPLVWKQI